LFRASWPASTVCYDARSTRPRLLADMNTLFVGFSKNIEMPRGGYLLIDDEVPDIPRSRVFDPIKHSFNPRKDIDYKRARELAELFYTISPQGDNTLTVRNGKRAPLKALLKADRLDRVKAAKGG
jgi:hypothetical protein